MLHTSIDPHGHVDIREPKCDVKWDWRKRSSNWEREKTRALRQFDSVTSRHANLSRVWRRWQIERQRGAAVLELTVSIINLSDHVAAVGAQQSLIVGSGVKCAGTRFHAATSATSSRRNLGGEQIVRVDRDVDVIVWKSLASSVQRARVTAHLMTSRHPTHRHHRYHLVRGDVTATCLSAAAAVSNWCLYQASSWQASTHRTARCTTPLQYANTPLPLQHRLDASPSLWISSYFWLPSINALSCLRVLCARKVMKRLQHQCCRSVVCVLRWLWITCR